MLVVNSNKNIIVNLDELSIKYSFEGSGDFYTINGQKLEKSGVLGSDIYFQRPNSTEGEILNNATLKVQTIAKFGRDKGNSTSEEAEFIFIIVQKVIKCLKIQVVSCVLNPVQNVQILEMTIHNSDECNINYLIIFSTKNCYNYCKSANKVRIESLNALIKMNVLNSLIQKKNHVLVIVQKKMNFFITTKVSS